MICWGERPLNPSELPMAPRLQHRSIRAASTLVFTVGCLLSACGGRSRTVIEVDDDDATHAGAGSAGAPNVGRAGAASGGAPFSAAGAPAAGAQPGGAGANNASAGASGMCPNVKCAALNCPAGYSPETLPGSCCPVCQNDCAKDCVAIGCGPGTHSEMLAGACCPVCVDDDTMTSLSCDDGMQAYAETRMALLYKYELGCDDDTQCVVVAPFNQCETGCGYEAIWSGAADFFSDNLKNAADTDCAQCAPGPIPPCAPPPRARCLSGECMFVLN